MTTLAYTYQRIAPHVSLPHSEALAQLRFEKINQKGLITFCLIGIIALGAMFYLGALYGVFSLGFQLQAENRELTLLNERLDDLELNAQRRTANFPTEHKEFLDVMEKISEVSYITGENPAVSYAFPHP